MVPLSCYFILGKKGIWSDLSDQAMLLSGLYSWTNNCHKFWLKFSSGEGVDGFSAWQINIKGLGELFRCRKSAVKEEPFLLSLGWLPVSVTLTLAPSSLTPSCFSVGVISLLLTSWWCFTTKWQLIDCLAQLLVLLRMQCLVNVWMFYGDNGK